MVAELPGFGLAPGEEDKGNESEPELETSKMVQVGCCLMIVKISIILKSN